jgi:hypothetical protein
MIIYDVLFPYIKKVMLKSVPKHLLKILKKVKTKLMNIPYLTSKRPITLYDKSINIPYITFYY